ncbi:MAG: M23 family metallopeptidase [Bacteroides sp.]|nr:M23 family metallopeptidase [Bacteroides sp.]
MSNKKRKKSFWKDIRFKYKLTILNENTLEEVAKLRVSKFNGLSVLFTILFLIFFIVSCILVFTPLRNYLPGYLNSEVRAEIVNNALRLDSLQEIVAKQNLYITNIQDIFKGEVKVDSVHSIDSLTTMRVDSIKERTEREEAFRKEYEEREKYNLSSFTASTDLGGVQFFRPTSGIITGHFNADKKHYGVDVAASANESIVAILDGVVILSTYTADTGYLIQIQHNQDFVSVYKHCGSLLKKQGDRVKAGEVIALVGDTGTLSTGPHLHFELWYKGQAVNPEYYIAF